VKHISGLVTLVYEETLSVITEFLTEIVRQSDTYTGRPSPSWTVDVFYVIKHQRHTPYHFDS